ncbi:inorganic phosphate transporter [Paraburkholderia sp. J10-1]|uniref:inorganic phosphate transporter n=1 Tax=Paraburkholderia sp. J10-1 TaxID=2805430 RepID=UPI002AB7AAFA|nr:inorganic phosphate transporter [Paraburkholderia sp. J10-1]
MHTIQLVIWTVILLVAIALVFNFMNGFHDAANSIATVVSTGVLKPHQAVAFAALFNGCFMLCIAWIYFRVPQGKVDRRFRKLQLLSAGLYSLGHGGNDSQKTIGIIWMLLIATGYASQSADAPPFWVAAACYASMGLGTLFGGWRIVRTMGQKITKLKPVGGFCAELEGALTLFLASGFGIPVSTTHTITGAIAGVGATRKLSAVRWGVACNIVWAWVLTIPASAALAATGWWIATRLL